MVDNVKSLSLKNWAFSFVLLFVHYRDLQKSLPVDRTLQCYLNIDF